MRILEAVKRGFGITSKNIKLISVLFVFNLIGVLLRIPFAQTTPGARVSGAAVSINLLLGLIGVLIFGGVLGSLKEFIKTQKSELKDLVRYGAKYYFRILGIWVLIALILMGFGILAIFGISVAMAVKNLVGVVIALAFALIVGSIGIYIFMLLIMSPYILIADDTGPISALKRSISFVRASLLKIIGLFLLLVLISIGMGFIVGIITGIITVAIKGTAGQLIIGIIGSIFNAYVNILLPASFMLFYMSSKKTEQQPTS